MYSRITDPGILRAPSVCSKLCQAKCVQPNDNLNIVQLEPELWLKKVISCSKSRYKPTMVDRAVDKRAGQLHREYQDKSRKTERDFGGVEEGRVGPVENKLLFFPSVQGMVFGEASEGVHSLVEALATSRVRVAGPRRGRKGLIRTEEGEKSIAVSYIRRTLSLAAIRAQ